MGIYTRKNIALLVLVEVWAARQRPPYLGRWPPDRNKIGARLCAKHQPQRVEKLCGTRRIPAGHSCEAAAAGPALRDTAALRHIGEM
jgi:hypothetical protein